MVFYQFCYVYTTLYVYLAIAVYMNIGKNIHDMSLLFYHNTKNILMTTFDIILCWQLCGRYSGYVRGDIQRVS